MIEPTSRRLPTFKVRRIGNPSYEKASLVKGWRLGALTKHLRLVISAALLAVLAWRTDWARIGQAFQQLRLELWLAAVVLYLVTQVVSGFRWQLMSKPVGFHGSLWQFTGFYFIGMFFNLLLPTSVGGDVIRAWYVARMDGRTGRRMTAFLSVLVDRVSGLIVLLLIACVAAVVCPLELPAWVLGSVWGMAGGVAGTLVLTPIVVRLTARFDRLRRLADAGRVYLRHPRLLLGTAGLSLVVQAANVALVWLLDLAIGAHVPASFYWILVPMVSLLTLLPISLNGMGIREGSMIWLLAPLGVTRDTALCLAILWFSVLTAVSLCGGLVYFLGSFPRWARGDWALGDAGRRWATFSEVNPHEDLGGHSDQGRTGQSQAAA
jgi:uncharacterized membrane protein YbhN (UPF0104 family)